LFQSPSLALPRFEIGEEAQKPLRPPRLVGNRPRGGLDEKVPLNRRFDFLRAAF